MIGPHLRGEQDDKGFRNECIGCVSSIRRARPSQEFIDIPTPIPPSSLVHPDGLPCGDAKAGSAVRRLQQRKSAPTLTVFDRLHFSKNRAKGLIL